MDDDGIALTSISHPKAPWYRRIVCFFMRLSKKAVEEVELDVSKIRHGGFRIVKEKDPGSDAGV